jgi:hypothetical protein
MKWLVFGYTDDCVDFEYEYDSFADAINVRDRLDRTCVVFVKRIK